MIDFLSWPIWMKLPPSMRFSSKMILALSFVLLSSIPVTALQQPAPRPAPRGAERRPPDQLAQQAQQTANSNQRGSEQTPFVVKIQPPTQIQKEAQDNAGERISNPRNTWSLSDKIAAIASIAAILQFIALGYTIWV